MAYSKKRTVQICLSDLPKDKMYTAGNGKKYISLTLWDMAYMNSHDQNVEVQVTVTADDIKNNVRPTVVGGGLQN
jgi:hypothetical protein